MSCDSLVPTKNRKKKKMNIFAFLQLCRDIGGKEEFVEDYGGNRTWD